MGKTVERIRIRSKHRDLIRASCQSCSPSESADARAIFPHDVEAKQEEISNLAAVACRVHPFAVECELRFAAVSAVASSAQEVDGDAESDEHESRPCVLRLDDQEI